MDFFPSESTSLKTSVTPPKPSISVTVPPAPAPVASHLNRDLAQAMKEVQGLGVALGQLRTMAGELDERYRALLETCGAADQRRQDIENTFARIDSLAQARLGQLTNAGELATRTEKMLARVEGLSAEADRQLAAIADSRNLVSREMRDLAHARANALLEARGAADQRCQDIENTFARIDSLAQTRLDQLTDAGELATRTEKMLARVEGLSAEANRQLAAIADARNLVSRDMRDLAYARANAQSRVRAIGAHSPALIDRFDALRARLTAAFIAIRTTTPRPSHGAVVYAALAALAVVAIAAAWPAEHAKLAGLPVVESRVLLAPGLLPSDLPQGIAVEAGSSGARRAAPVRATVAGFVGDLAIQSSPRGATVFVDGKPIGETPISPVRIRAGSHAIWIDLARHHRWTASVRVPAGALTTVNATLQRVADGQRVR